MNIYFAFSISPVVWNSFVKKIYTEYSIRSRSVNVGVVYQINSWEIIMLVFQLSSFTLITLYCFIIILIYDLYPILIKIVSLIIYREKWSI